jgi:hypothetical protein
MRVSEIRVLPVEETVLEDQQLPQWKSNMLGFSCSTREVTGAIPPVKERGSITNQELPIEEGAQQVRVCPSKKKEITDDRISPVREVRLSCLGRN